MIKRDETKNKIVTIALELFQKYGFEKTTMRQIAKKANLSLGAFYYYYNSKDSLVLDFYLQTQKDLRDKTAELIILNNKFSEILKIVYAKQFEILVPYKSFLNILIKNAADPSNPLSPFSQHSKKIRQENISLFKIIIEESKLKISGEFKEQLPHMLWLLQMALIFFWLFDSSEECVKSFELINNLVDLLSHLLKLQSFPLIKPFQKSLVQIISDVISEIER